MKINNRTLIYIYIGVLFILTYLLASRLLSSFRTLEFDYLRISINFALLIYIIIKVLKLSKIENNTND